MKTTTLAIAAAMAAGTLAHAQEAVQWRVEDGGNGHWYRWVPYGSFDTWTELASSPTPVGAHLATITSAEEEGFVRSLFESGSCVPCGNSSIFVGAYQDFSDPGYAEPAGGWRWVTGEPWSYTNWYSGEPNDSNGKEHYMCLRCAGQWNDGSNELPCSAAAVIEWSADCNGDGIVDYGQILLGELVDANANGVPDTCECDADINDDGLVNGADISVLLGYWGQSGKNVVGDITGDGIVNGADLAQLLGSWGECP